MCFSFPHYFSFRLWFAEKLHLYAVCFLLLLFYLFRLSIKFAAGEIAGDATSADASAAPSSNALPEGFSGINELVLHYERQLKSVSDMYNDLIELNERLNVCCDPFIDENMFRLRLHHHGFRIIISFQVQLHEKDRQIRELTGIGSATVPVPQSSSFRETGSMNIGGRSINTPSSVVSSVLLFLHF
jgi:hypothetical protein